MNSDGLPERETLLVWMSAFLDGELSAEEEALLERAMDQDPELLRLFEELSGGLSVLASASALSADESASLTRSILAATAPAELDATPDGATQLASLYIDDALEPGGTARLEALLAGSKALAGDVRTFAQVSEAVGATLHALPSSPGTAAALAPLTARLDAALTEEERAGLLWSAALDGELSVDEEPELERLFTADRAPQLLPFVWVKEASHVALRSPIDHPDAARAGAAALHAIAAYQAQAADAQSQGEAARKTRSAPEGFSLSRWFGRFLPVAAAAACAVAFALIDRPAEPDSSKPPPEWVATFQDPADTGTGPLNLLDNNSADVQALDSGSHMAAVFATEESHITVIWVAEPEAPSDSETGT